MSVDSLADLSDGELASVHEALMALDKARESLADQDYERAHEATARAERALSEVVADE